MSITIKRYVRKPFEVEAVQVTDRNFSDVVAWCEGEAKLDDNHRRYIEVAVRKPINKRQTTAYVGDFVVLQRKEFKVFKNSSFRSTFDEVNDLIAEQLKEAGHLQLEIEETNDGKDQHITIPPKKQKHGQNGWNTKVAPETRVIDGNVELRAVSLTHDGPGEVLSVTEVKENDMIQVQDSNEERREVIPGYTYEEAMAAGRAGDGNVRQQLDALVMESEGIVYDWNAPAGHELDEAIRQGKAQPFDTDDAAVTVVQVDPEAALTAEKDDWRHWGGGELSTPDVGEDRLESEKDERNYPREVEEDRPIGI